LNPEGQGCQMACFQTNNPNSGKFWRDLEELVYFMAIGHYGYLVYFPRFGMLH
jgi:hypothetical protein